jgi:hypothetical protein
MPPLVNRQHRIGPASLVGRRAPSRASRALKVAKMLLALLPVGPLCALKGSIDPFGRTRSISSLTGQGTLLVGAGIGSVLLDRSMVTIITAGLQQAGGGKRVATSTITIPPIRPRPAPECIIVMAFSARSLQAPLEVLRTLTTIETRFTVESKQGSRSIQWLLGRGVEFVPARRLQRSTPLRSRPETDQKLGRSAERNDKQCPWRGFRGHCD